MIGSASMSEYAMAKTAPNAEAIMALNNCEACGGPVSSAASACPKCGHPVRAQEIEATSKKWKSLQLGGAVAVFLGFPPICNQTIGATHALVPDGQIAVYVGLLLLVGGMGTYLYGRFGAWWHHS